MPTNRRRKASYRPRPPPSKVGESRAHTPLKRDDLSDSLTTKNSAQAAGTTKKWLCDVCQTVFDDYYVAMRHENFCRYEQNRNLEEATSATSNNISISSTTNAYNKNIDETRDSMEVPRTIHVQSPRTQHQQNNDGKNFLSNFERYSDLSTAYPSNNSRYHHHSSEAKYDYISENRQIHHSSYNSTPYTAKKGGIHNILTRRFEGSIESSFLSPSRDIAKVKTNYELGLSDVEEDDEESMKWVCDVCQEAQFENYVEAFRHEMDCRKTMYLEQYHQKELQTMAHSEPDRIQTETRRAWRREQIKRQWYEKSKHLCSSINNIASPLPPPSTTPQNYTKSIGDKSTSASKSTAKKWLCSVCKEKYFDHYLDACRHEKECILVNKPQGPRSLPPPRLRDRREGYF